MTLAYFWNTFSPEEWVVTLLITIIRVLVESSATILVGVLCAAGLRVTGGVEFLKRWLGAEGRIGRTFRLIAGCLCVPVCAFGVLPIVKELYEGGLPRRDIAVIWLVAPLVNPLAILYAISVLPIWQCGVFLLVACLYAVLVAEVAGRFQDESAASSIEAVPVATHGTTRLWNATIAAGRIVTGWSAVYIMLGTVIAGMVIGMIPSGAFEQIFSYQNVSGPLKTMALTGPQIVTPITFTMAISAIHHTHLAFACAIALQLLGVAWCGGTLFAMRTIWGSQRTIALLLATLIFSATLSYGTYTVFPPSVGEEEETHGLDTLAKPYHATFSQFNMARDQQLKHTDVIMLAGSTFLVILMLWGVVVRWQRLSFREDPEPTNEVEATPSRWNVELTPGQIGLAMVGMIALGSVMLLYSLFPSVDESFAQMQKISADAAIAVKTNRPIAARQKLAEWDTVAARLPVGWVLRLSVPNNEQASQIRQLRALLWETSQQMTQTDLTAVEARQKGADLIDQFHTCKKACTGEQP
ncbi:permease [Bremerella alba]|uniref:Permease n=1 Tax=Bremerella alba TaxID=980252 RepID=A0A7V8V5H2_9BACT|nr:permease [Bremerella alba]MBA2115332.1 hypothetical protein [Bremerella alba]